MICKDSVISTGWFGEPGKTNRKSKVHLVSKGKPVCGAKMGPRQQFQWCSHDIQWGYIECESCRKVARKIAQNFINDLKGLDKCR